MGNSSFYAPNQQEIDASPPAVQASYLRWRNPPPVELYDLANDPWEFENLANADNMTEVKQLLLKELNDFRVRHGDPLLDPEKLSRLAAEHDHVHKDLPDGRYGAGQHWRYLKYLKTAAK